jgi:hypothetical protein
MGRINVGKVVAGGILAWVILAGFDYATSNYLLALDWQDVARLRNIDMSAMGSSSALVTLIVVDAILGQLLVLVYAAIRPRFGPGPATAAIASFMVLLPEVLMFATFGGIFIGWDLFFRQSAVMLVSTIAAGIAGAWVYAEEEPEVERPAD